MTSGPHRVDGEFLRWVLKLYCEDRVDPSVSVFNLHVEVGEGSAIRNILRDGDLILLFIECRRFIIDVPYGHGDVSS